MPSWHSLRQSFQVAFHISDYFPPFQPCTVAGGAGDSPGNHACTTRALPPRYSRTLLCDSVSLNSTSLTQTCNLPVSLLAPVITGMHHHVQGPAMNALRENRIFLFVRYLTHQHNVNAALRCQYGAPALHLCFCLQK